MSQTQEVPMRDLSSQNPPSQTGTIPSSQTLSSFQTHCLKLLESVAKESSDSPQMEVGANMIAAWVTASEDATIVSACQQFRALLDMILEGAPVGT